MAEPRRVIPGQLLLITRRTSGQDLRLRPSAETNQGIRYALGVALQRSGLQLHAVCVMPDHHRIVVSDPLGRFPVFLREFHRLTAKVLNAAQGRSEHLWVPEPTDVLPIVDCPAIAARIASVVTSPVAAGLVKRPEDWSGVVHWNPGVMRIPRPSAYFDPDGDYPEFVELEIVRPSWPNWSEGEWGQKLTTAIEACAAEAHEEMKRKGWRFIGRAAVRAAALFRTTVLFSWRGDRVSRAAASEPRAKRLMILVRRTFLKAYKDALRAWCGGARDVVFPYGTWWMRVHHGAAAVEPHLG